ncbi:hypothetical protein [Microbispora sp. H10949]|uniref:hypothetical protein n=1 Tax=Microbispora sp. H10949 TaxID=2729111 RepID=UPI001601D9A8|nr:hypothetical protein [Microbispora sp. H10949]
MKWHERWDAHVVRSMEHERFVPLYRTRARRRLLVASGATGLLMMWADAVVTWRIAPSDAAVVADFVLLALMLVLYLPAVTALNAATRGLASLPERRLDERQVAERLRAYTKANTLMRVVLTVVLAVVFAVMWGGGRTAQVPAAAVVLVLVALWLTHLILPLLVAGWRLPDPPPDDEPDQAG